MIALWFGAIVDVPTDWQLCDGTNGTPNLRDRFPVSAGDTYSVNDTGGILDHDHNFTSGGHNHQINSGALISVGVNFSDITALSNLAGTTDGLELAIPFYGLAYIQAMV